MATLEKNLEIANLVCKFGNHNLLDLYQEVIEPSFFKQKNRKAGKSNFYFDEISLVNLGEDILGKKDTIAIVGRFVKQTQLEREQYRDSTGKLIKDKKKLASAPSAIFALILNNHRLLYAAETKYAPTPENFRSTLSYFIRNEQINYKDSLPKEDRNPFLKEFPIVEITLTPLTNQKTLNENINLFNKLRKVIFILNDRNSEIDGEDMFRQMQETSDEAGGQGKFEITNNDGLNKKVIAKEANKATIQGNQNIVLLGTDKSGNKLKIDNEDVKIQTTIEVVQNNVFTTVLNMFSEFKDLILSKDIKVKKTDTETQKILNSIDTSKIVDLHENETDK
ncbi:hypothetical protein [Acinetobacter ursingii]|uniref:hypothetical protein n=1 Tax=Acinetobacter ursingii TaxID=108980 RepID=UPI0021CD9A32|nr:hypothetical protein [Acinetobacter ursingii]MCU4481808.1 hypothetical protein [Acinetobacter ursingii]MCU4506295.1 hypothetical protein [Acinetobacter ursingii]MCU4571548.1 hypothetical protein [Acinetobacter ursingii]